MSVKPVYVWGFYKGFTTDLKTEQQLWMCLCTFEFIRKLQLLRNVQELSWDTVRFLLQLHHSYTYKMVWGFCCMRWVHIITRHFAHLSTLWRAYEDYRAPSGMCKSVCKCLLLKQNRHLIPTGQELRHYTLWNLKSDLESWAAIVIRGTHQAGRVTVWLRCPIRHGIARIQTSPVWPDPSLTVRYLGWTPRAGRSLSIGLMAPMGPTYPSVCAGLFNSLKSSGLWL